MFAVPRLRRAGQVSDRKDKTDNVRLTDEQRIDWLLMHVELTSEFLFVLQSCRGD
jgi:hypothetical protein